VADGGAPAAGGPGARLRRAVPEPEPAPALARPAPRLGRRGELWAFLELLALCGFVVVQPVLEVIGGSPDFLIFHGVTGGEIMWLVAAFVLVPPVLLWGLGVLCGLAGGRVRRGAHLASVGLLLVLFMVQLGKHVTPLRGMLLVLLAGLAVAVVIVGYLRLDWLRQLLRFAAAGPLVFVLLFAFVSPSSAVVFAGDSPVAGGETRVVGANPPIVMIVLDELPLTSLLAADGTIDEQRFPHFARLAGDATWYRNATTVSGWTPYALPAMLTGTFPAEHVAPHYSQYPDNLFTLLGDVYRIEANESIAQLCPPWHCGDLADRSRGGLPAAMRESLVLLGEMLSPTDPERDPYGDFAEPTVAERLGTAAAAGELGPRFRFNQVGANQPARFESFLQRLQEPAAGADGAGAAGAGAVPPTLHFLHLLMPHTPWTYLPTGMRYENVPGLPVDGPWWGRLALQRMELQLQYTDLLLGEILHVLAESGRYDESLVVVTADHGVALTPGTGQAGWIAGSRQLGPDNHGAEELAWVPLFIKEPGQSEGAVDDRNWQHVDLLPTLADLAGVAVPWPVDGISWQREERSDPAKTYYSELDDVRVLDGPALFARILADPDGFPRLPPPPSPELLGTAVSGYPVTDGPAGTVVDNAAAFADVRPEAGTVPGLVHATLPAEVPEDATVAIAVNGRIGAVVPVVASAEGGGRVAGLVVDADLFRAGENLLELFVIGVSEEGTVLQRLPYG
jgi:hypothetical protein